MLNFNSIIKLFSNINMNKMHNNSLDFNAVYDKIMRAIFKHPTNDNKDTAIYFLSYGM